MKRVPGDCIVVIPTYNEKDNIEGLVNALMRGCMKVLIVDDNSPDGTGEIADHLSKKWDWVDVLHRKEKTGLGSAYRDGFDHVLHFTRCPLIAQMDADGSHPVNKLPVLADTARAGYDLVIGSRYVKGGSLDVDWGKHRRILSRFGNSYARTLLKAPYLDMTGGFRVWRRETLWDALKFKPRANGYAFQIEMLFFAHWMGKLITEVPIHFQERANGKSKMSLEIQLEAALRVLQLGATYAW